MDAAGKVPGAIPSRTIPGLEIGLAWVYRGTCTGPGISRMKQTSILFLACLAMLASACDARAPRTGSLIPADAEGTSPSEGASSPRSDTSVCDRNEQVVFSCKIEGDVAYLCASKASGNDVPVIRYLQGPVAQPKLIYSSVNAASGKPLRRSHLGFAGGTGGYAYSFEHEGAKYIVYSISGAEALQRAGVLIALLSEAQKVDDRPCEQGSLSETEDVALIKSTLSLPSDPDIEREGLPALNN